MKIQPKPVQKGNKFLMELGDLITGALLPFIVMLIFGSTITMFAGMSDVAVQLTACIGGNVLIAAAYVIFGTKNGSVAYRKLYVNQTKRALNSSELKVVYGTGEYAFWKGIVIPFISCVPYLIFQIINIAAPNSVCRFMLMYAFGWAYYPFTLAGLHEALGIVMIAVPIIAHAAGYFVGMRKEEKLQAQLEATNAEEKAKKKKRK